MSDERTERERRLAAPFEDVRAPSGVRRWQRSGGVPAKGRSSHDRRVRALGAAAALAAALALVGGTLGLHGRLQRSIPDAAAGGATPAGRSRAAMAYDDATGTVLLFGGRSATGAALGDTWSWDGDHWTQLHPAHAPSARSGAASAYDPDTGRVVLVGEDPVPVAHARACAIEGGSAAPGASQGTGGPGHPMVPPPSTAPSNRILPAPSNGSTPVCPVPPPPPPADSWTWDGHDWTQQRAPSSPALMRGEINLAYDPAHHTLVLVGRPSIAPEASSHPTANAGCRSELSAIPEGSTGAVSRSSGPIPAPLPPLACSNNATWLGDGSTWKLQPGDSTPAIIASGEVVFDPATGHVEAFQPSLCGFPIPPHPEPPPAETAPGRSSLPTAHPGASAAATQPSPTGTSGVSLCRIGTSAVSSWSGAAWTPAVVTPVGSTMVAMLPDYVLVRDGDRSLLALNARAQSARWDGHAWTTLHPPSAPAARLGAAAAWDAGRHRVVLFGGRSYGSVTDADTWTWDGSTWTHIAGATPVPPSSIHEVPPPSPRIPPGSPPSCVRPLQGQGSAGTGSSPAPGAPTPGSAAGVPAPPKLLCPLPSGPPMAPRALEP